MNEWSPGGSHSRPATPNQTGRSFRPSSDEPEKGSKPLVVNIRAVTDSRSKSFQENPMRDISKSALSIATRNEKIGNGVSDPRFKRVISPNRQNNVSLETEPKIIKPSSAPHESQKSKLPVWNSVDHKPSFCWGDSPGHTESKKPNCGACTYDPAAGESLPWDFDQNHLTAMDKLSFSHDVAVKSISKESLSDGTMNTRNSSLASDDLADELPNDLSLYSSHAKKVHNWMQEQKEAKLDKKQSVITVIGQTQGQDTLSSAMREIDARRKLVKELDKHAVCNKIIDSDKEKDVTRIEGETGGKLRKSRKSPSDFLERRDGAVRHCSQVVECKVKESSSELLENTSQKHLTSRRKSKRFHFVNECPVKGKIREFLSGIQFQWMFCVMIITSMALCWFALHTIQNGTYVSFDLFSQKPKPLTWYEKICTWIWELFRPSNADFDLAPVLAGVEGTCTKHGF